MKLLMALTLLAVIPSSAVPATGSVAAIVEPRQIADKVMQFLAADDLTGMFDYMARNSPMKRDDLMKMRDSVADQRKKAGADLGKLLGYAFIGECRRAESLVRLVYVEKHENQVMRWEFVFYKPRDKWIMTFFHWDLDLERLFDPCH